MYVEAGQIYSSSVAQLLRTSLATQCQTQVNGVARSPQPNANANMGHLWVEVKLVCTKQRVYLQLSLDIAVTGNVHK